MCASCGCGCKLGKPEKGCKCTCKMCREARSMSVEKSFMVAKALRGFEPIEAIIKADDIERRRAIQRNTAAGLASGGALVGAGSIPTAVYGATQARKGRKAAVGGRTFGRSSTEGFVGAVPGLGLVAHGLHAGNKATFVGGQLAALGGATLGMGHGAHRAMRNAQKRGDIK